MLILRSWQLGDATAQLLAESSALQAPCPPGLGSARVLGPRLCGWGILGASMTGARTSPVE
eukprot:1101128-Alexandrium_andersonii.AAC.1